MPGDKRGASDAAPDTGRKFSIAVARNQVGPPPGAAPIASTASPAFSATPPTAVDISLVIGVGRLSSARLPECSSVLLPLSTAGHVHTHRVEVMKVLSNRADREVSP